MSWWTAVVSDETTTLTYEQMQACFKLAGFVVGPDLMQTAIAESATIRLNRPRTFDAVTAVIAAHTDLMARSAATPPEPTTKGIEIWEGGVFCLTCPDTPHCEKIGVLEDRPASSWRCPECKQVWSVDDYDLALDIR